MEGLGGNALVAITPLGTERRGDARHEMRESVSSPTAAGRKKEEMCAFFFSFFHPSVKMQPLSHLRDFIFGKMYISGKGGQQETRWSIGCRDQDEWNRHHMHA